MNKKLILIYICLLIISINFISLANEAQNHIYIEVTKNEIEKEEEFSFTINLSNISIAAFDININFDSNLFEYVSGPENTNVINGKIITVWYDNSGGNNTKQNCELVKYTLKAKEIGTELISIEGNFYNAEGENVENITDGIEIISKENEEKEEISLSSDSTVADNNSKLSILRLNHEGISPIFSPDITEYYFLTENLNTLEVTAVPQNSNSEVLVTGNTNIIEGLNTINIQVISADKSSVTEYKIFVTKTRDLEKANANLETLAIENVTLEPQLVDFMYNYNATVSDTTENLNILAVPENQNASVQISGGENLVYGNNKIIVNVIAENGYTSKKYVVNVYRRNEEEQKIVDEEQELNVQKLNNILENKEKEENNNENEFVENIKENKTVLIISVIVIIIVLIIVIYRIKKQKKKKLFTD